MYKIKARDRSRVEKRVWYPRKPSCANFHYCLPVHSLPWMTPVVGSRTTLTVERTGVKSQWNRRVGSGLRSMKDWLISRSNMGKRSGDSTYSSIVSFVLGKTGGGPNGNAFNGGSKSSPRRPPFSVSSPRFVGRGTTSMRSKVPKLTTV